MQHAFLCDEHYRLFIKMSIKKAINYLIVIAVCFHVIIILYEEKMLQIKKKIDFILVTFQNCFIKENH